MQTGQSSPSVILFFIDGLGIGPPSENNPLSSIPNIEPLDVYCGCPSSIFLSGTLIPTDPRLGVEGRPQSASGQTTILTGQNAPQILGYHKQGFPNEKLREVINEHSIFKQLDELRIGPNVFTNAYTPRFFAAAPRWKSATTCAVEARPLCSLENYRICSAAKRCFTILRTNLWRPMASTFQNSRRLTRPRSWRNSQKTIALSSTNISSPTR